MEQQNEVRIPPKRLRLVGILCACVLYFLIAYFVLVNLLDAIRHEQNLILNLFPILVILVTFVTIPYFVLFAVWAFARLALNLPALILTPVGIVNHSTVYHVVIPWDEIEQFIYVVPEPLRYRRGMTGNYIIVLAKDKRRLYELQQPVTKVLLRLFSALLPVNISTAATAGTQEDVWAQLQHYVRKVLPHSQITFDTL